MFLFANSPNPATLDLAAYTFEFIGSFGSIGATWSPSLHADLVLPSALIPRCHHPRAILSNCFIVVLIGFCIVGVGCFVSYCGWLGFCSVVFDLCATL